MWVNPFRTIYVKFKPVTLSDFTCWGLPVFQPEVYRIKNLKNDDYEVVHSVFFFGEFLVALFTYVFRKGFYLFFFKVFNCCTLNNNFKMYFSFLLGLPSEN